jgi:phage terminase small subunit
MPRKSSAALAVLSVDGTPPRLQPPATLSPPERKLFDELVAAADRKHFRATDLPLLCRYVEAAVMAEQAARELREHGAVIDGKPSPWIVIQEKSVRAMTALSMRLRLSPQARLPDRAVARQKPPIGPRPWA